MKIRMIAFDLDYTMLKTGGIVSERTAAVLKKAKESGILLVPSTGRDLCEMGTLMESLSPQYLVSVNGAVVRDVTKIEVLY